MNFNVGGVIYNGQVLLSGVATQIPDPNQLSYGLNLIAYSGNTFDVFIGTSGVTAQTGFVLNKGFVMWLQVDHPNDVWAISNAPGTQLQQLHYLGM